MIICVNGVLWRTVVSDWRFDNLCGSHLNALGQRAESTSSILHKGTEINCVFSIPRFFIFYFFIIIILFLFCNIYRTNTYTTYDTNIILSYIYIYITLLILTLFIQANRTNTYTTYSTYNTNIILTCTFTLHYSYLHYSYQRDFFIRFYNALATDLTYIA